MWDFDEIEAPRVIEALGRVQQDFALPQIYLLESSPGGNWIAYCFDRWLWKQAFVIVAATEHVDWRFVQHSLVRGYFTLRLSRKHGVEPKLFCVLPANVPESCSVDSLRQFVRYQTKAT